MVNLRNRGQPDRSKINLDEDHKVKYWTRHLRVSKEKLSEVIEKVGNSAAGVKKELALRELAPNAEGGE